MTKLQLNSKNTIQKKNENKNKKIYQRICFKIFGESGHEKNRYQQLPYNNKILTLINANFSLSNLKLKSNIFYKVHWLQKQLPYKNNTLSKALTCTWNHRRIAISVGVDQCYVFE